MGRKEGVPRSIRIEYPGAFYHVMARGNRREAIFQDDRSALFSDPGRGLRDDGLAHPRLGAVEQSLPSVGRNPRSQSDQGMQWLQNAFTRRFNARHGLWGRFFGDRYKAVLVEGDMRFI